MKREVNRWLLIAVALVLMFATLSAEAEAGHRRQARRARRAWARCNHCYVQSRVVYCGPVTCGPATVCDGCHIKAAPYGTNESYGSPKSAPMPYEMDLDYDNYDNTQPTPAAPPTPPMPPPDSSPSDLNATPSAPPAPPAPSAPSELPQPTDDADADLDSFLDPAEEAPAEQPNPDDTRFEDLFEGLPNEPAE